MSETYTKADIKKIKDDAFKDGATKERSKLDKEIETAVEKATALHETEIETAKSDAVSSTLETALKNKETEDTATLENLISEIELAINGTESENKDIQALAVDVSKGRDEEYKRGREDVIKEAKESLGDTPGEEEEAPAKPTLAKLIPEQQITVSGYLYTLQNNKNSNDGAFTEKLANMFKTSYENQHIKAYIKPLPKAYQTGEEELYFLYVGTQQKIEQPANLKAPKDDK